MSPNPDTNLLSGLPSLSRMSARDQTKLAMRLREAAFAAKAAGDITLAGRLVRAVYELPNAR